MNSMDVVTKTVKKYGNSGGVYLPSSWIGGEVEARLLKRPQRPEVDLAAALAGRMEHIVSILLYGSYARGEQARDSDIDVIIVTDGHRGVEVPRLGGRYDVKVMSRDEIKKAVRKDALFKKALENSRAIFNDSFADELKSIKVSKNLGGRVRLAKSSLNISGAMLELDGGSGNEIVYSVMMRIKEMLLVKCVQENREYSFRLLESCVRGAGITRNDFKALMSSYRAVRDGKRPGKEKFGEDVLRKLLGLLEKLVNDAEKKEKTKKRY